MKKVCVPRLAVYAKYESSAGDRSVSCRSASHGVSQRTMGMRRLRRALRHLGSRLASVQRRARISCPSLAASEKGHTQWPWCLLPASSLGSFRGGTRLLMVVTAGEGASCWRDMATVAEGRGSRGRGACHDPCGEERRQVLLVEATGILATTGRLQAAVQPIERGLRLHHVWVHYQIFLCKVPGRLRSVH
jgi:hypothetical protein